MFSSCTALCPPEFKKVRSHGVLGTVERCVHRTNNARSFPLIDVNPTNTALLTSELNRVRREGARVQGLVDAEIQRSRTLNEANDAKRPQVNEFSRIRSEYAAFKTTQEAAKAIRDTTAQLRTARPPTAPASDLETERRAITDIAKRNLYFIQIALFLVVAGLLAYIVLPVTYAHGIAFLLLSVGISVGFFLRR